MQGFTLFDHLWIPRKYFGMLISYAVETLEFVKYNYLFTACFNEIFKQDQSFVDMPPIFAMVVESFPDHLHYLWEGHYIVGEISYLWHNSGWGAPGVIAGGLTNFNLKNMQQLEKVVKYLNLKIIQTRNNIYVVI